MSKRYTSEEREKHSLGGQSIEACNYQNIHSALDYKVDDDAYNYHDGGDDDDDDDDDNNNNNNNIDDQWLQASLPIKDGGLGIRRVSSLATPAF